MMMMMMMMMMMTMMMMVMVNVYLYYFRGVFHQQRVLIQLGGRTAQLSKCGQSFNMLANECLHNCQVTVDHRP